MRSALCLINECVSGGFYGCIPSGTYKPDIPQGQASFKPLTTFLTMLLEWSAIWLASTSTAQAQNITKTYGQSNTQWTSCGTLGDRALECATIHVPLDHFGKYASNKTFSVPMTRMLVNSTDAETILINPGGPGAGGIEFLMEFGESLDVMLDGRYHLLGFDPRYV